MQPAIGFDARLAELLDDPSTSMALRSMIRASLERDPLDALADAEVLADLLHRRFNELRGAPAGAETLRAVGKVVQLAPLQPLPLSRE